VAVSGTFYLKKWMPNADLAHGKMDGDSPPGSPPPGGPPGNLPPGDKPTALSVELADHGTPGENYFEGDVTFVFEPQEDGTLQGTANGTPIVYGYYTGDEFFKVEYTVGPGQWEICARVDRDGNVEGIISVGNGKGFPNLCYGKKL